MKILWLCNIPLPIISKNMGKSTECIGGWMTGMLNEIKDRKNVKLTVLFPTLEEDLVYGEVEGIQYYGFPENTVKPHVYDYKVEDYFKDIIKKVNPDIVHIFGTEFPHTLAMTKVFNKPEKTVINIQGLCSIIEKHYYSTLPTKIINRYTVRDLIKNDNIKKQRKKFRERGKFEVEAIKNVNHIIGRTEWDEACVKEINRTCNYYKCNETLREEFYNHQWNIKKCNKHSIFVSQGSYPIKGLHFIIEAMSNIIKIYPDAHLYIAGNDITKFKTINEKLKISSYSKYIRELIFKYKLNNKITFLGSLDEQSMCKRFLESNVFVSGSTIENESNSISEAKILGVPVIASYVGGTTSRIEHGIDGYQYQYDAPYMLSNYIDVIFNNDDIAIKLSKESRKRALSLNDKRVNFNKLMEIYYCIYKL